MLLQQLLREARQELEQHNIENAEIDVTLLLGHCLQMSRTEMIIKAVEEVDESITLLFRDLIKRRSEREPVAYIVGEREFWSLPFIVNESVLIPRPETEFLLETVFREVEKSRKKICHCLDLCCGSGIIAVVLALELGCKVNALDLSNEALKVTTKNAIRHGVESAVRPICSDLFAALGNDGNFPLIVSNPPYVRTTMLRNALQPEVSEFEPHLALDGGPEGLDCVRRISRSILQYLEPEGMFFMEFGADQALDVKKIFKSVHLQDRFFETLTIHQDYSGRDRVLFAKVNNYNK